MPKKLKCWGTRGWGRKSPCRNRMKKKKERTIQERRRLCRAKKVAPPEMSAYQDDPEQVVLPDGTWLEIYNGRYVPEQDGVR